MTPPSGPATAGAPRGHADGDAGEPVTREGASGIVLAGVLGQPVLATARLLAEAAMAAGLDASSSRCPVRGSPGALVAHVRMGPTVHSPLVSEGEADVLVGFEQLEALRMAPFLAPEGFAALNDTLLPPWRMRARLEQPPEDVASRLRARTRRVVVVPARVLAGGCEGAIGFSLLGVVAALLPVPLACIEEAISASGAREARDAFARGRRFFDSHR